MGFRSNDLQHALTRLGQRLVDTVLMQTSVTVVQCYSDDPMTQTELMGTSRQ